MVNKTFYKRQLVGLLLLLSLPWFGASCTQKEEKKDSPITETADAAVSALSAEEQLYQEVMTIHDEAMLRMSEIRQLSKQLTDSIEHTSVSPMEQEETINHYRNQLQELKKADEAMWQWMRAFDYKNVTEDERMNYLLQEKEKMEKVESQMDQAISNARDAMQQ